MKLVLFSMIATVLTSCAMSRDRDTVFNNQRDDSASNTRIETYPLGTRVLRVIVHNMELTPKLEMELFGTEPEVTQKLTISNVTVDGENLDFTKSAGVFVEAIQEITNGVIVKFEYFYTEGGYDSIDCRIQVRNSVLEGPNCYKN